MKTMKEIISGYRKIFEIFAGIYDDKGLFFKKVIPEIFHYTGQGKTL